MKPEKRLSIFHETTKEKGSVAAFIELYASLSPKRFIQFGLKRKKDENKNELDGSELFNALEFWDEFLPTGNYLSELLNTDSWDELQHRYFSNKKLVSKSFMEHFASLDPEKLIASIRLYQAFLDKKVLKILVKIHLPEELKNHQKIWIRLHDLDQLGWKMIRSQADDWVKLQAEEFLAYLISWLETKRFEDDSIQSIVHLTSCYNFIISLYSSDNYSKAQEITPYRFSQFFDRSLIAPNKALFDSFNDIFHWVWLHDYVHIKYCFDLNVNPTFEGEDLIGAHYDESKFERSKKNEARFGLNQGRYKQIGTEITEALFRQGDLYIPPGKRDGDFLNNKELFAQTQGTLKFLEDLCLDQIIIDKRTFDTNQIIEPILAYSFNRSLRFEDQLEKFRKKSNSWEASFYQLNEYCRYIDVDCDPYFLMTQERYIDHNIQANTIQQHNCYAEIISQLGDQITERDEFNRHDIKYDVWHTPFFRFGQYLFCPMMFFAKNTWFYAIAQVVMKNYHVNQSMSKETSTLMEEYLLNRFQMQNNNWNCWIPVEEHAGDIDLWVSDGDVNLLIQLKRTMFRMNPKEAYMETAMIDGKAIDQLEKAERFFKDELTSGKTIKWYVSTSFENVNQEMESCVKINYMELVWALEKEHFDSILELATYMRTDKILEEEIV